MSATITGIIFDKDGTLFDFHTTWSVWTRDLLQDLARTHDGNAEALARAIEFDLAACRFLPTSPIIAATNREGAEALAAALPGANADDIEEHMRQSSGAAPLRPPVPLDPFLTGLAGRGLKLGVVTNDTDHGARAHLTSAGVLDHFDFVAGYDSGHGAKPAPDPLLAFARQHALDPARCVMVGDSTHDLRAGRAAGMWTLGVLTGMAGADELASLSDAVLPDIGHIPAWLDR
ncbi:HAD family hydrolase [Roseovarius nanhaiticus]|uniref:HAD family hydrolase n=1 Tax=Roseovarius nanhaiticus TaxID=573024 RepID=UPI00249328AA|nr:HAD family hydrolase [Roseovarius nanhaiticus]